MQVTSPLSQSQRVGIILHLSVGETAKGMDGGWGWSSGIKSRSPTGGGGTEEGFPVGWEDRGRRGQSQFRMPVWDWKVPQGWVAVVLPALGPLDHQSFIHSEDHTPGALAVCPALFSALRTPCKENETKPRPSGGKALLLFLAPLPTCSVTLGKSLPLSGPTATTNNNLHL